MEESLLNDKRDYGMNATREGAQHFEKILGQSAVA